LQRNPAGCKIINVMTRLGMPVSQRITWAKMSGHQRDLHLNYAPKPTGAALARLRGFPPRHLGLHFLESAHLTGA
jgi:hypothetical protein